MWPSGATDWRSNSSQNSDTLIKYRMAIAKEIWYHEIWYHEISYGHTVFHDSMKYRMAIWNHEIPYGHTVFHDSMKYSMAIRYFMIP